LFTNIDYQADNQICLVKNLLILLHYSYHNKPDLYRTLLRTIGDGLLAFPASISVAYTVPGGDGGELFVADHGNAKIQVFSLTGALIRAYRACGAIGSTKLIV
jgi:hypothetical protein